MDELIVVPKLIALLEGCQIWLYVRFTNSWSWLHLLVHLIGLSTISSGRVFARGRPGSDSPRWNSPCSCEINSASRINTQFISHLVTTCKGLILFWSYKNWSRLQSYWMVKITDRCCCLVFFQVLNLLCLWSFPSDWLQGSLLSFYLECVSWREGGEGGETRL